MSDDEQEKSFKVKDNRRFDADGNDRESIPKSAAGSGARSAPSGGGRQDAGAPQGEEEIDFASFVMSLATQAFMQLGEVPAPEGIPVPVDRAAAKQTIDIISLLKKKTEGNLDPNETHLIDEILHTLRIAFVKKT